MHIVLRDHTLGRANFCFLATGRSCLAHLIERYSPDCVFTPALVPDGVIAPFEAKQIPVRHYKLKEGFEVDLSDLEAEMHSAAPTRPLVIVIAYFGYPVSTREAAALAHHHSGLLLLDMAHALQGPDNSCADMELFSLNKMIPVPDGAVLVSKTSEVDLAIDSQQLPRLAQHMVDAYMRHLAANHIMAQSSKADRTFTRAWKQSETAYEEYYSGMSVTLLPCQPSNMSRIAYHELDFKKITDDRKCHADAIKNYLRSDQLYRTDTPTFALPLRSHHREDDAASLLLHGIFVGRFEKHWREPSVSYLFERDFLESHLLLPITETMKLEDAQMIGLLARGLKV